jgi:acylphosphatase
MDNTSEVPSLLDQLAVPGDLSCGITVLRSGGPTTGAASAGPRRPRAAAATAASTAGTPSSTASQHRNVKLRDLAARRPERLRRRARRRSRLAPLTTPRAAIRARAAYRAGMRQRVVVHGRVQGVFFRDTCRRRAVDAGVTGWVRNLDDGTVEAVLEGPDDAVDALVRWCHEGPDGATVTQVDVHDEEPQGEPSFVVR